MITSKKSQIAGQVFIFILAAAMAILIIVYGYKAISSFTSRTEEIALINFKTGLQSEIRTIASDYGSVKKLELMLPQDFKEICFIDLDSAKTSAQKQSTSLCSGPKARPEVCDAWKNPTSERENVFLIPSYPIKVARIQLLDSDFLCMTPIGNKLSLRLEGKGDRTYISEWLAQ